MSEDHPDRSRVGPTALGPDRFAWEPGETVVGSGDVAATVPRRYRGCTAHRRQLLCFSFPLSETSRSRIPSRPTKRTRRDVSWTAIGKFQSPGRNDSPSFPLPPGECRLLPEELNTSESLCHLQSADAMLVSVHGRA
jgi:hypothetical protein